MQSADDIGFRCGCGVNGVVRPCRGIEYQDENCTLGCIGYAHKVLPLQLADERDIGG